MAPFCGLPLRTDSLIARDISNIFSHSVIGSLCEANGWRHVYIAPPDGVDYSLPDSGALSIFLGPIEE